MREVVLDTETTGLKPAEGHRIVEIGCVAIENGIPDGATFHQYINPERDMPAGAFRVHGLSAEFLGTHPAFADVADGFLDFIGDSPLIIHNARFDMGFINAELARLDKPPVAMGRCVDTLEIARRKFPGRENSLDALCRRFSVDNSGRDKHGALLDAELLAAVYLELCGGRQPDLVLADNAARPTGGGADPVPKKTRRARPHGATPEELVRHAAFIDGLKEPIWRQ